MSEAKQKAVEKLYDRMANGEHLSDCEMNFIEEYESQERTEKLLEIKKNSMSRRKDGLDKIIDSVNKITNAINKNLKG